MCPSSETTNLRHETWVLRLEAGVYVWKVFIFQYGLFVCLFVYWYQTKRSNGSICIKHNGSMCTFLFGIEHRKLPICIKINERNKRYVIEIIQIGLQSQAHSIQTQSNTLIIIMWSFCLCWSRLVCLIIEMLYTFCFIRLWENNKKTKVIENSLFFTWPTDSSSP